MKSRAQLSLSLAASTNKKKAATYPTSGGCQDTGDRDVLRLECAGLTKLYVVLFVGYLVSCSVNEVTPTSWGMLHHYRGAEGLHGPFCVCLPAEEFPQVQVLNPLDGFDRMIHRPFIQSCYFFKLVGVSAELDELKHHHTRTDVR